MKESLSQTFVKGSAKGLHLAANSILPNIMLAYALVYVFQLSGLLDLISRMFAPVMKLAGLPGAAATVFFSALLSGTGAAGTACSLYITGALSARDCCVLFPSVVLMTGQVQYLGRVLDVIGVERKYKLPLMLINVLLGFFCMLAMDRMIGWGLVICPAG